MTREELATEVSKYIQTELPDVDPVDLSEAALQVQGFIENLGDEEDEAGDAGDGNGDSEK
jgi:hypothetical protein